MKRILIITLICYLLFAAEFVLYNSFGAWGKPELLILAIVFFNLYLGIRFGIIAALICGLLKDSISIEPFGTYLFVYTAGAYATTFARQYLYQPGSRFSRAMVAFFAVASCFIVQSAVTLMNHEVRFNEVLVYLLIPQLITTMVAATFVFHRLRDISVFFALKT
jgi:rod shape-determining protein MreD